MECSLFIWYERQTCIGKLLILEEISHTVEWKSPQDHSSVEFNETPSSDVKNNIFV